MTPTVDLLVIDGQEDFCNPKGALYVKGADEDMNRVAEFIRKNKNRINNIHFTLDSHQALHIAHPIFWKSPSNGKHPDPFTIITLVDLDNGVWTTTKPGSFKYGRSYVEQLAQNGRYPLCIWPPHCLIGTKGAAVYEPLMQALLEYANQHTLINFVTKGSNWKTEHYSAIKADVADPNDVVGTGINTKFLETINSSSKLIVTGEASSHCVANTLRDACDYFPNNELSKKIVIFKDAMSPVPGFEKFQDDLFTDMQSRLVEFSTTTDYQF